MSLGVHITGISYTSGRIFVFSGFNDSNAQYLWPCSFLAEHTRSDVDLTPFFLVRESRWVLVTMIKSA